MERKSVTFDWEVRDANNNRVFIEVKNEKFGEGDEEGFIRQISAQLKTIEIFPDLKGSRL